MNRSLLILAFAFISSTSQAQWTLIWSDEFDGNTLDTSKWVPETGGWGWGNNELQYYTDGDNLSFLNGSLIIEAREEQFGTNSYTSGKIITKGIFDVTYGKIDARIKVPLGQGIWPAFWMLGANIDQVSWPYCGEIDVMEHVNNEMATHGTAHWHNGGGHVFDGNSTPVNPSTYQLYSVEWNDEEIRWFLNGNQFHYLSIENNTQSTDEFHLPFYLILNLAVGGNWPGYPDATTTFPTQLEVDYVRVYKPESQASVTKNEAIEISISPNPATDIISFEAQNGGIARVLTLDGSVVSEQEILSGSNSLTVEDLADGLYLLRVESENGVVGVSRFVKE